MDLKAKHSVGGVTYDMPYINVEISEGRIFYCKKDKERFEINIPDREDRQISEKILYSSKLKKGFLIVEKHRDLSYGCSIFRIDKDSLSYMCEFPFAAYTSENGDRMNYNNILPYISIICSDKRVLLFMNTPMVVEYPNETGEQIKETSLFYHILKDGGFEMRTY